MRRYEHYAREVTLCLDVAVFLCSALPAGAQGAQEKQFQLPDGDGKAIVQNRCSACHGLNMIQQHGGLHEGSVAKLFSRTMVKLPGEQADRGGELPREELPDADQTAAVRDSRTRDRLDQGVDRPPPSASGRTIRSGRRRQHLVDGDSSPNVLGRLDPKTGTMKEFPLKAAAGPHGLVADKEGNIWYTGNRKANNVGKLDPKTGAVTEYALPDPKARGPHTPIFDQKGNFWFTLQSGHVGRVVPSTGEVKLSATPTSNTYPYGIQVNSKGVPWYVDFRGNRLGSIDPVTMEIKEYTLPNPETRPRRIALTPDDVVWYADYSRGYLGRYDPKTGQTRECASPSGAQVPAIWHRDDRQRYLVQRSWRQAEYARALRHRRRKSSRRGRSRRAAASSGT